MRLTGFAILGLGMVLNATPATAAPAPPPEQCCACTIQWGSTEDPATIPALFCEEVLNEDERLSFLDRCSDAGGGTTCATALPTIQPTDNVDCSALLLDAEQIACPATTSAPVPLLDTSVLAGLALGLAGLGAWAVRRRGATRHPR